LLLYLPLFEEEILDSLYLTIGNSNSLGLGYWLESGHLTGPGQIAEYQTPARAVVVPETSDCTVVNQKLVCSVYWLKEV
jgi:hypothetical protein